VTAARGVYHQRAFHFQGRHYEVEAGGLDAPLAGQRFPTLTTIGESAAAIAFAARHADVHLFAGSDPRALASQRARLADAADKAGRAVAAGVRVSLLARATDDEAKRDLDRARSAPGHGFTDSGVIIGGYDTVAATINALADQGISHFVLSGQPSLEEAYRFAEQLAPRLQRLAAQPRARTSPAPRVASETGAIS
jgi:alkanesulfonate monooxygenase